MADENVMRDFTESTCRFINDNFPEGEYSRVVILAYLSTIVCTVLSGCCEKGELKGVVQYFAQALYVMASDSSGVLEEEG